MTSRFFLAIYGYHAKHWLLDVFMALYNTWYILYMALQVAGAEDNASQEEQKGGNEVKEKMEEILG